MSDLTNILTATLTLTGGTVLLFSDADATPQPVMVVGTAEDGSSGPILARLDADGRLYVPVTANGQAVRFMVDTGANVTLIDPELARNIGFEADGGAQLRTVGGFIDVEAGRIAELTVDSITVRDMRVLMVKGLPRPILGMDVLSHSSGVAIELGAAVPAVDS